MEILIATFITLAMVGSVMWVMPSARQKALTQMRAHVMQAGCKVRLMDARMNKALFPWVSDGRGFVLYEKLYQGGQRNERFAKALVLRQQGREAIDYELMPPLHQRLDKRVSHFLHAEEGPPLQVEAVLVMATGVAVLWCESEGVRGAERVIELLERVHGAVEQLH